MRASEKESYLKQCRKCKKELPESEFTPDKARSGGLKSKCRKCNAEVRRERYHENRIEIAKSQREYMVEYKKKNPNAIPDIMREYHLKKTYGITVDRYNEMFIAQQGKCAICGRHQSEFKNSLCIDHNHKTGKVRTLLCIGCNYFVGRIENNIELVRQIIKYVEEADGQ